jgi:predicted nicotinamide N-methyase
VPDVPGGYVEELLELGGRTVRYLRPADPSALLELPEVIAAYDRDGDAPYWAHLWPPVPLMAQAVFHARWPAEATVLEVGCGIGVVGLAAAAAGRTVAVSDKQPPAVRLAVANAALNGLTVEGLELDWFHPIERTFDVILGCDVTYDADFHAPLLGMISRMLSPAGEAWFADFGRLHAPLFASRAEAAGFAVALRDEEDRPLSGFRTAEFQLFKLRRR